MDSKIYLFFFKAPFLLTTIIAVLTIGCREKEEPGWDVPVSVQFRVPAGLNAQDTHYFPVKDVNARIQDALKDQGVDPNTINSVTVHRARLDMISPLTNYGFVFEAAVSMCQNNDVRCFTELAYRIGDIQRVTSLDLNPNGTNVKDLAFKNPIKIETRFRLNNSPGVESDHFLNIVFRCRK
jgi:hypothetical protein